MSTKKATFKRTKTDTGFEGVEQARQRLEGTTVVFDGEGYSLRQVTQEPDGLSATLYKLPVSGSKTNKSIVHSLKDPKFNRFRPFELGFVNLFDEEFVGNNTNCLFTYRRPLRSGARQGLSREALDGRYLQNSRGTGRCEGWNIDTLNQCQSFADMLKGSYPTYVEAVDNLINNSSIAFDRNYAVLKDVDGLIWLYRKLERIGLVQDKSKEILLFSTKGYLREEIQETKEIPHIISEI